MNIRQWSLKKKMLAIIALGVTAVISLTIYKNVFSSLSPNDPSFNIKRFHFAEYADSQDIVLIFQNYFSVGAARKDVEIIIQQAGGIEQESGSAASKIAIPGFGYGYDKEFLKEKIDVSLLKEYKKYEMPMKMSAFGRAFPGGRGRSLTVYYDADNKLRLLFVSGMPAIY